MNSVPMIAPMQGSVMCSRAFILAMLLLLSSVACNFPINEEPLESKPIDKVLGDSTGCLSNVVPTLEQYFGGEAQEAQIEATWNCVSTTLNTFEKSVEGRYEDRFTSRELAHFIEQYFLEDGQKISDELLVQIFRIKQLFVGGSVDYISRKEVKFLTRVVQELKEITLELNPHMMIFSMNWKVQSPMQDSDLDKFEAANVAIQKAAKKLAVIIERNGVSYDISNFAVLLRELSNISAKGWSWVGDVEKAIPLVKKLKKTLAGGDESVIDPQEWKRFALLGGRGYVQYLRYHYFIKEAPLKEGGAYLAYFIRSVDDLFSYLGDMVDGKKDKILTRQELLEIAEALSALIPDLKISDQLMLEVMKIKVVFFGGRVDFFVKDDFERARAKLEEFRQITQKFLDYRDVFGQDWDSHGLNYGQIYAKFKLAEKNINEVAKRLGQIMEDQYDINDLIKLATEFEKLYPTTDKDKTPLDQLANQYVPTLVSIKNILFSDKNSVIGQNANHLNSRDQWSAYLGLGAQFYCRYLTYYYFLKGNEIDSPNVLFGLERVVYDSLDILEKLVSQKPQQVISWQELDNLASALIKTKALPDLMTAPTLSSTLRTAINKVLVKPEIRLAGYTPLGFAQTAIDVAKSEFALWLENQKFFDVIYSGVDPLVGKSGADIMADIDNTTATVASLELKMIYFASMPLSFDAQGRMYIARPYLNYTKKTSTIFNIVRSGARLLIRSFAGEIDRITGYIGITEKETDSLYLELRPILSELKLVHPKNDNFGVNRFRDAGLFTDIGNGDANAGFSEISHLLMMILSGLEVNREIYDPIEAVNGCSLNKNNSVYPDDWDTDLKCINGIYFNEMSKYFVGVPDFMSFQTKLDRARFDKMFLNLLIAAGYKEKTGNKLMVGDLALVPHVIQYIETFFQLFDANKNGVIETPEALRSYPKFETILKQVSGLKDERDLKGLLTWMLKYGKPPESGADKIKFKMWWVPKGESGWAVSAERDQLASILAYIAKAIDEAKQKAIDEANSNQNGNNSNTGSSDPGVGVTSGGSAAPSTPVVDANGTSHGISVP